MFISTLRRTTVQPGTAGHRGRGAAGLLLAALLLAARAMVAPAAAEEPVAAPTAQNYTQVTRACKADYARFCEAKSDVPATGRDQAICLKFHKQDLALPCRTAVNAVSR